MRKSSVQVGFFRQWHKCAGQFLYRVSTYLLIIRLLAVEERFFLTYFAQELLQRICCCLKFLTFVLFCHVFLKYFLKLKLDVQVARYG
jgi:hypothetical protein